MLSVTNSYVTNIQKVRKNAALNCTTQNLRKVSLETPFSCNRQTDSVRTKDERWKSVSVIGGMCSSFMARFTMMQCNWLTGSEDYKQQPTLLSHSLGCTVSPMDLYIHRSMVSAACLLPAPSPPLTASVQHAAVPRGHQRDTCMTTRSPSFTDYTSW